MFAIAQIFMGIAINIIKQMKEYFYIFILISLCLIKSNPMKTTQIFSISMLVIAVILSLNGCAGMSAQDRNTAIGAGVGAVGGAALTGGGALGTVGGAAVGGVIGHEVGKDKK